MGFVDDVETAFSLLVSDEFIADRLKPDIQFVYMDDGGLWIRTRVSWEFTDQIKGTIGTHFFWGGKKDLVGEFYDNDQVFFELKYGF